MTNAAVTIDLSVDQELLAAPRSYKLYYVYADSDEDHLVGLEQHLVALERQKLVEGWNRRKLLAGEDWQTVVDQHFSSADIILLLISPDFLDSKYCYDIEVERAMRRHAQGDVVVIPIILRPCMWDLAPFAKCKSLPSNEEPVSLWDECDSAFLDITQGIRKVILGLQGKGSPSWRPPAHTPRSMERYGVRECVDRLEGLLALLPSAGKDLAELNKLRESIGELDHFIRPLLLPKAGDILAGMELIQPVGSGAFATVWLSKRPGVDTKERFATKVLHATCLTTGSMLWRFRRGVKAMRYLTRKKDAHPHIVPLLQEDDSSIAFTMPFLPGQNLDNVRERKWTVEKKVEVVISICRAVEYAHRRGVVHRDIKPANIVFDAEGEPVLTDFDIADMDYATTASLDERGLGSPMFAAPEQLENSEKSDVRFDVYSIGRLVHYLLVEGPISLNPAHPDDYRGLSKLPGTLVAIVRKATQRRPSKRYQDVASLRLALQRYRSPMSVVAARIDGIRSRFILLVVLLLSAVLSISIVEYVKSQDSRVRVLTLEYDRLNEKYKSLKRAIDRNVDEEKLLDAAMEALVKRYHDDEQNTALDESDRALLNTKLLEEWKDLQSRKDEILSRREILAIDIQDNDIRLDEMRRRLVAEKKRSLIRLVPADWAPSRPTSPRETPSSSAALGRTDAGASSGSGPATSLNFTYLWPQVEVAVKTARARCASTTESATKLELRVTIHTSGQCSARSLSGSNDARTACVIDAFQSIRVEPFSGSEFHFNRGVDLGGEQ